MGKASQPSNDGVESPGRTSIDVTPHVSDPLSQPCRFFYVGVAGDIQLKHSSAGSAVVFKNVPVGIFPFHATHIVSTLTTASEIRGVPVE